MSYEAIITRISTRPHPNADKLQLGVVAGHQVVTGLDTVDGTRGVFFPEGGALSHEFCYHNNEYRENKGENRDPGKFGYFEENRRIRTIKLRGAISEGYWVPLSALVWTDADLDSMAEGDTFTELNGHPICQKYFSPATIRAMKSPKAKAAKGITTPMFREHFDTKKLRYCVQGIPEGARIIITEKCHGTSGRTAHVQQLTKVSTLPWYKRGLTWLYNLLVSPTQVLDLAEWKHFSGSRRVVLESKAEDGFYTGTNFRQRIHDQLSLKQGETLYYEIVGFDGLREDGATRPLMGAHLVGSTKDKDSVRKELARKYGEQMVYSYGCDRTLGEYKILVYRITQTNEMGDLLELSWDQIRARTTQLGLQTVPEFTQTVFTTPEELMELCSKLSRGSSTLDSQHIREGVCIRIEHPEMFGKVYKFKSFDYCHLEGIKKNDSSYVDLEEIS